MGTIAIKIIKATVYLIAWLAELVGKIIIVLSESLFKIRK